MSRKIHPFTWETYKKRVIDNDKSGAYLFRKIFRWYWLFYDDENMVLANHLMFNAAKFEKWCKSRKGFEIFGKYYGLFKKNGKFVNAKMIDNVNKKKEFVEAARKQAEQLKSQKE